MVGAWAPEVTPRFGFWRVVTAWVVAIDLPGTIWVARYQRMRQHLETGSQKAGLWFLSEGSQAMVCNHDCGGLGCRGHGGRMVMRACLLGVPVMSAAA